MIYVNFIQWPKLPLDLIHQMDNLSRSIRFLEAHLLPNIGLQEYKSLTAEIMMLKEERKKLEAIEAELRAGVSFYGSYFSS